MQEFTSKKESSPAPPVGHWPSDEELAAYIDGTLEKEESQRITEHLADCEECYAVYAETLQFQLESEAAEGKDKVVVPFPSPKRWQPSYVWLPAAAALLLVTLGGWYAFQNALLGPAPKLAVADVAPSAQGRPIADLLWNHNVYRGEGEEETELDRGSFQIGALLIDFRLSAQAGDVPNASETWRSIGRVVKPVYFMAEDGDRILAQANQISDATSLSRVAATADTTEKSLGDSLSAEYLDFGKWTEAGRVAALTRDPAFFKNRKNQRFLAYALRDKEIQPSSEVRQELEEIARIWDKGELGPKELASLERHFQKILDQYDFTA
jgi:putative zinc finger protein